LEERSKVKMEFERANEKDRRTKYASNPNYVYEQFGWEQ
jgi:hypothetical protein